MLKYVILSTLMILALPSASLAQHKICGSPPEFSMKSEEAENLKGELQGKAQLLSRFIGDAGLSGKVETERKIINQQADKVSAAQQDAYLAYMFCILVMDDTKLTTQEKINAINEFRKPIPGRPIPPPEPPSRVDSGQYAPGLRVEIFSTTCGSVGFACPERPEGELVGCSLDRSPPTFGYSTVLKDQKLAPFLKDFRQNLLGLRWSGLLQVDKEGDHVFSLIPESRLYCRVAVKIQDQPILNWNINQLVVSGTVSLNPGFHTLEIWMVCNTPNQYQQVKFQLRMRVPGDQIGTPILPARLVHEQPESACSSTKGR